MDRYEQLHEILTFIFDLLCLNDKESALLYIRSVWNIRQLMLSQWFLASKGHHRTSNNSLDVAEGQLF